MKEIQTNGPDRDEDSRFDGVNSPLHLPWVTLILVPLVNQIGKKVEPIG